MKALYTTILAVVWALTAQAQVLLPNAPSPGTTKTITATDPFYENFESTTVQAGLAMSSSPRGWDYSTGTPLQEGAQYLRTPNGNSNTRYLTVAVNTTSVSKVGILFYERVIATPITRNLYYRIGNTGPYTLLSALIVPAAATPTIWKLETIVLPADAGNKARVEIVWEAVKANGGNTPAYAIDAIEVLDAAAAGLPVELSSFNAQTTDGTSKLAWTTASETNNEKFEVERSTDGANFSKVGEVKGSGNSVVKRTYAFTDKAPTSGVNYYRLKQVDFDGAVSYSNVVALEVAGAVAASVYPTVATSSVKISLQNATGNATINVTDMTGRVIATYNNTTLREIEVPVHNFKSGMYFVRVTDGQSQQVQRFIKE